MNHDLPTHPTADTLAMADPARQRQMEAELERRVAERTRHLETQSREMEAALRQARVAAAAAHRAKTEFLANLSHEIRTPMNAILGYAQLLQRDSTLPETVRGQIEIIERNGQKLTTLLESILDLSKTEAGQFETSLVVPESTPANQPMRRRAVRLKTTAPACRILVVDDEADNRKLMLKLLRLIGFEVEAVANGMEALAAFDRWRPQLVLMDTRMPEMNGLEAIRRLRVLPGGSGLKIISLSAAMFPEDRSEAINCGADEFLSKPVEVDELLEKMRQLLGLEYDYQPAAAGPGPEHGPSSTTLSPMDLTVLPAGLRQQLLAAVVVADFDEVNRLLLQVQPLDASLARRLGQLAENFDAEQLIQWLDAVPKQNPAL